MTLLVDNQLPADLARHFEARGYQAQHVLDIGMTEASDVAIWEYAGKHRCVLISKDVDFLHLANTRPSEAKLIWIRIGNCRTPALLAAMERLWPRIEQSLLDGERIVEVR